MKKLIVAPEQFEEVIEKFKAELRCGVENSELHFFSDDGQYIIEYHLPLKPSEAGFMVTTDPINYDTKTS